MLEKFFNSLTKKPEPGAPVTVAAPPPPTPLRLVPQPVPPAVVEPAKPVVPPAPGQGASRTADISLYKNLMGGLHDGVLIFDEKGSVIGSNPRAGHYLGYTEQELWGMPCEELVVGFDSRLLYQLRANAEAGRFTVVNANCKRKDGGTFPAEIAISRMHLLSQGDFIFSIHKVDRREPAPEARPPSLADEAVRSAGTGIVVCNQEGTIEFANPAFLKILRLDQEQAVLKHLIADFCNSYELVDAMLHAPSTQGAWLGVLKLTTPAGGSCDVLVTSALGPDRSGGEPRLVLTMTPLPKAIR